MSRRLLAVLLLCAGVAGAQESDFEVKREFEQAAGVIRERIDSARATATLDSMLARISALEARYAPRQEFLDRALYPQTFVSSIRALRDLHALTYDRVWLIQSQGIAISEYEARITALERRIDTLTTDNRRLMGDLAASRKSLADLRERVRRLSASLQARDRLVFALVDTIFLPYDKNLNQVSDVQKEAITRKLLKSNVVARVFDIASDNIRFLESTQLQGKDFSNLLDQYREFSTKWTGLKDKMESVTTVPDPALGGGPGDGGKPVTQGEKPSGGKRAKGAQPAPEPEAPRPGVYVDSALVVWNARLQESIWTGIGKEFSSRGVPLKSFGDGPGFAAAVQSYVDSARADGRDPFVFVNDVWKTRVDKEWRSLLERPEVLGKIEYAALDRTVSELGEKRFDLKFVLYVVLAAGAAFLLWWVFSRKPKPPVQAKS